MSQPVVIRSGMDRLRYILTFEAILVTLFTLVLAKVFQRELHDVGTLAVVMSLVAMGVNFIYNYVYDRIDAAAGRVPTERSPKGRLLHAVLFEVSLLLTFLPLTMAWLDLTLIGAIAMNAVGMTSVVIYTFIFTWIYDRVFPVVQPSQA